MGEQTLHFSSMHSAKRGGYNFLFSSLRFDYIMTVEYKSKVALWRVKKHKVGKY